MIPTFVLLTAAGGGLRLALNVAVRRKLGLSLGLPPILALAVLLLAVLPDITSPQLISTCLWACLWGCSCQASSCGGFGDDSDGQGTIPWLHSAYRSLR